jgi:hypothetical protein
MGRRVATLMGLAVALALPAGAEGAVLHDQTAPPGFYSSNSQNYDSASDPYDDQLADDFTVPAGEIWTVKQVDVLGEDDPYLGMSAPPFVNVFLYAGDGTLPGAERFHQSNIGVSGYPNDSVPLNGASALGPGTYWISVQEQGGEFMVPSWYWKSVSVQDGHPAVFQNPSGGLSSSCTTWKPVGTCFAGNGPDMAWKISGSALSQKVTFGKLQRLPDGTAKLTVNMPGNGILTVGGKGVRGASDLVGAPKSVTVRIKATGRARRLLNATGKVTVKPYFGFSAPGATPSKTIKKVKLRKG